MYFLYSFRSKFKKELAVLTGGHFVCKLFDLFTPFSVGLVYLMRLVFNQVCICKPVTSRPANSERWVRLFAHSLVLPSQRTILLRLTSFTNSIFFPRVFKDLLKRGHFLACIRFVLNFYKINFKKGSFLSLSSTILLQYSTSCKNLLHLNADRTAK